MTITLGAALEALILEHEYSGELDAAVEEDRVWMACTCGAVIARALEPAMTVRLAGTRLQPRCPCG